MFEPWATIHKCQPGYKSHGVWAVIEGTARLTKHNRPGYDEELPGPSTMYKADHLNVAESLTLDNGRGLEL